MIPQDRSVGEGNNVAVVGGDNDVEAAVAVHIADSR